MFKKEILIFLVIFLSLALMMHMDEWLTRPLEHLSHLSTHKMPYHPLLYTTIVYSVVGFVRLVAHAFMKLFKRR